MTANVSNQSALLKVLFPKGVPYDLTYQDFPFLSLIPRDEAFYGVDQSAADKAFKRLSTLI